jgi:predicted nucleotidyltransferase
LNGDLKCWAEVLRNWACATPEISEVWIFGSRAKGSFRPDSDLDIAIVVGGETPGERLADWISCNKEWKAELQGLLEVRLDLQLGNAEWSDKIVGPSIREHGIRIYSAAASANERERNK